MVADRHEVGTTRHARPSAREDAAALGCQYVGGGVGARRQHPRLGTFEFGVPAQLGEHIGRAHTAPPITAVNGDMSSTLPAATAASTAAPPIDRRHVVHTRTRSRPAPLPCPLRRIGDVERGDHLVDAPFVGCGNGPVAHVHRVITHHVPTLAHRAVDHHMTAGPVGPGQAVPFLVVGATGRHFDHHLPAVAPREPAGFGERRDRLDVDTVVAGVPGGHRRLRTSTGTRHSASTSVKPELESDPANEMSSAWSQAVRPARDVRSGRSPSRRRSAMAERVCNQMTSLRSSIEPSAKRMKARRQHPTSRSGTREHRQAWKSRSSASRRSPA